MTAEDEKIAGLKALHARSEYAGRPLVVAGVAPSRTIYVAVRDVFEVSDDGGSTWLAVPGTENGVERTTDQSSVFHDPDFPADFRRLYRVYGLAELAETSPALIHVRPTNYSVDSIHFRILDLPSRVTLAAELPRQTVTVGRFECQIEGRHLTAVPLESYIDMRTARADFEDAASLWRLQCEMLTGANIGLQLTHVTCTGDPAGALWQFVPGRPSNPAAVPRPESVSKLPSPPTTLARLPSDAASDRIRARISRALLNREPVASLAYWVREVLESHLGQAEAHERLRISDKCWSYVGRLSGRHDWREGRKVTTPNEEPLTRLEAISLEIWVREASYRMALFERGADVGANFDKETLAQRARQYLMPAVVGPDTAE